MCTYNLKRVRLNCDSKISSNAEEKSKQNYQIETIDY